MKKILILVSLLMLHLTASADDKLDKGKTCIKEKIGFTALSVFPVELKTVCSTPVRLSDSEQKDYEEEEYCITQGDKDVCRVYFSCRGDGQSYRFAVEAKVKYPSGLLASGLATLGLGPSCQLSELSVSELQN